MVHYDGGPNGMPLVLCGGLKAKDMIELTHCGTTFRVPRSHFVDPQSALQAALEFKRTGHRPETGDWIEFSPEEPCGEETAEPSRQGKCEKGESIARKCPELPRIA